MPYSQFTLSKVKEDFQLTTIEVTRFLPTSIVPIAQLEDQTVTIDLTDYPLLPVEQILGFLVWMVQQH